MANFSLLSLLTVCVGFLPFVVSPVSVSGGCFTWGANDNLLFDQQYIEAICNKDIHGWFSPGQRREICIDTGFKHQYSNNPGSVLFAGEISTVLEGCKQVFYWTNARCHRGGDFEIRWVFPVILFSEYFSNILVEDFHWNFMNAAYGC